MEQTNSKQKHILIAEDDNFYASIYRQKLSELGYSVDIVRDGDELIKLLANTVPDLVMLDVIMPKKDGFETLKEIRSNPVLKDLNVLILSNLGQNEDVNKAMELGATGYIVKNLSSIQDIITKIKETIGE